MEPLDPKLARLVHDGMVEAVPDQAREDRVLLGLLARLPQGGPPGGDGVPGGEGAAAAGSAGAAAGGKVWVLAVVLGAAAVTGGVVLGGRRDSGSERAAAREPARSGAAPSTRPEPVADRRMPPELAPTQATQPTRPQPVVPDATGASTSDPRPPSTHERERPSTARRAAGEAASDRTPTPEPATPAPADDELSAEIQQIAAADRALARGEAHRALQLAREHAKDHPHGQLAREREAIELGARCQLDEPGAAEAAAAFVRAHADAPAAAKVRARCPGMK